MAQEISRKGFRGPPAGRGKCGDHAESIASAQADIQTDQTPHGGSHQSSFRCSGCSAKRAVDVRLKFFNDKIFVFLSACPDNLAVKKALVVGKFSQAFSTGMLDSNQNNRVNP